MVCNVFCKNNECNGNVCNSNGCNIGAGNITQALESGYKGEIGNPLHICKCAKVDNEESLIAARHTNESKDSSGEVTCKDTDDKGDHLNRLFAINGAEHYNCKGYKSANKGNVAGAACGSLVEVVNGSACQRKTDQGNCGADNNGRHQLVDPLYANELNNDSDHYVNKTCHNGTEDQANVAGSSSGCTCKCRSHRAKECKGGAQEYRASKLCKEQINERTNTGTKQSRSLRHSVADNNGNNNGCCHNCQKLLEGEDEDLTKLGFVFDVVDEIHFLSPSNFF